MLDVFFFFNQFLSFSISVLNKFFYTILSALLFSAQILKELYLRSFFVKLWGFENSYFSQFDIITAR